MQVLSKERALRASAGPHRKHRETAGAAGFCRARPPAEGLFALPPGCCMRSLPIPAAMPDRLSASRWAWPGRCSMPEPSGPAAPAADARDAQDLGVPYPARSPQLRHRSRTRSSSAGWRVRPICSGPSRRRSAAGRSRRSSPIPAPRSKPSISPPRGG